MANQEDKKIKMTIENDNPGVQRFNASIASMTASVEKLAATLEKVTRSMESFNKVQGKTGGGVGKGKTTGKASSIAETIVGDPSGVRNAAKVTETALSATGSNIKRFVDNAIKDMARLRMATAGVGGGGGYSYGGNFTSSGAMPSGGGYGDYAAFEREMAGIGPSGGGGKRGGFWTGRRSWRHPTEVLEDGSTSKFWGPKGFEGYAEGRGQAFGRLIGLPTGGQQMIGGWAKGIAGSMGVVGGAGAAVVAAYEMGARSFENTRGSQIEYSLNKPLLRMGAAAATASLFQDQFSAAQSGNLSRVRAFNKATKDPEMMRIFNNLELDKEKLNLQFNQSPLSGSSAYKWIKNKAENLGSRAWSSVMETITGNDLPPGVDKADANRIMMAYAQSSLSKEKADKFRQVQNYHEVTNDPMANLMMNRLGTDSLSRVQAMRANLLPTGFDKNGNLNYEKLEAKLMAGGWTLGDRAGGVQQLLGVGHGYGAAVDPMTLVSAGIGGFTNAAQVTQAGGILGGSVGAAGAMYQLAQRNMGRGGLDVATARDLFGGLSKQMIDSGQFGMSSAAHTYMAGAAGIVGGAGTDVASQQYRMGLLFAGNEAYGNLTSGRQAPIYGSASLISAISASGGKYGYEADTLKNMDPTLRQSIAMGGQIPPWLQGVVSQESAKKYLSGFDSTTMFLGMPPNWGAGTAAGDLVSKVKSRMKGGGSWKDVLRDDVRGLSGKTAQETLMTEINMLGSITGKFKGQLQKEAAGTYFQALVGDETLGPLLSGSGVGAASPRGLEKISLAERQKFIKEQGESLKGKTKEEVEDALKEWHESSVGARQGVTGARGLVGDLEAASESLVAAITSYTQAIVNNQNNERNMSSSGQPVKATTKQKASQASKPARANIAIPEVGGFVDW
jgi:hypothetical protein